VKPPAKTASDDPNTAIDESADNLGNDPSGGSILTPLVIRNNPGTVGPDSNYLKYTGVEHVLLGGTNGNDILIGSEGDDTLYATAAMTASKAAPVMTPTSAATATTSSPICSATTSFAPVPDTTRSMRAQVLI
jgi:hypothetical protein